jgi:hypothetical protein
MRRQDRDRVTEDARVDEIDLAAAALLRRRTDQLDRDLELLRALRSQQERADVRHRDEVVSAGVPDLRERVVLGEQCDGGTRRPDACPEGGLDPAELLLDLVTVRRE